MSVHKKFCVAFVTLGAAYVATLGAMLAVALGGAPPVETPDSPAARPAVVPARVRLAEPPSGATVPSVVLAGPETRPSYRAVVIDGTGSTSLVPLEWRLLGSDKPLLVFDRSGKPHAYAVVIDPEPGELLFVAFAVGSDNDGNGIPDVAVAVKRVTITADIPPVPVVPPAPTPAPITAAIATAFVYDENLPDALTAGILKDATLPGKLSAIGATWSPYEGSSRRVDDLGLRPVLADYGGPPLLIVSDSTGKILGITKKIASATEIVKFTQAVMANPDVPPPPPRTGPLHVEWIYDGNAADGKAALIRGDSSLSGKLASLGARWRDYEISSKDIDKYNLRSIVVANGGPPLLIVRGPDGRVLGISKDAQAPADIITFVKGVAGK